MRSNDVSFFTFEKRREGKKKALLDRTLKDIDMKPKIIQWRISSSSSSSSH